MNARGGRPAAFCLLLALTVLSFDRVTPAGAQAPAGGASASLIPATTLTFSGPADSNSPAVWTRINGVQRFVLLTSMAGAPTRHVGSQVSSLVSTGPIGYDGAAPPHGVWMESIIPDVDDTWYGFYHNEWPAAECGDLTRTVPRIGAARSTDFGTTWQDLGVILEAPRGWHDCDTLNRYFVGGVGDFTAILDRDAQYLYFFFSQYSNREQVQGVAVGRMAWADRDTPAGKMTVWSRGATWVPTRRQRPREGETATQWLYPAGVPIYRATEDWHDADREVDAFWGPSVHWNTYLQRYVMLLNRAQDTDWRQEGVYIAFASTLDDPAGWSTPKRLLAGGQWYPQVIGLEAGVGTDKVAGERARFFLGGRSQYFIQFSR